MAHWARTLDLSDLWDQAHNRQITAHELGQQLASLLEKKIGGGGISGIVQAFRDLPEDATFDDFDVPLNRLYDWADKGHRLWIRTF